MVRVMFIGLREGRRNQADSWWCASTVNGHARLDLVVVLGGVSAEGAAAPEARGDDHAADEGAQAPQAGVAEPDGGARAQEARR